MSELISLADLLFQVASAAKKAGRTDLPSLMAVSKTQPIEKMISLYSEGQRLFGENYVQELIEKRETFDLHGMTDADIHFIGHLQTNKVKALLPHVTTIHSVDSIKLLEEIDRRAVEIRKVIHVFFQINIDAEASKGGFHVSDLDLICHALKSCQAVQPMGLMCIPDPDLDPRRAFHSMKILSSQYCESVGSGLSMGMSHDFEAAIAEGSTVIRVGSKLFGERKKVTPQ